MTTDYRVAHGMLHGEIATPNSIIEKNRFFQKNEKTKLTSIELTGLSRTDGKHPDGMTLIPRQAVRPVVWDITVACISADSYVEASAREVGATTAGRNGQVY